MADTSSTEPVDILLVEDNPGDVRLTREAFAGAELDCELHVVGDGEAALDFLHRRGAHETAPRPDLVLLDLNLPRMSGLEVLEAIAEDPALRRLPVVVLTSSTAEEDVVESYEQCSNAYLTKPVDPDEFVEVVRRFEAFWLETATLPPQLTRP